MSEDLWAMATVFGLGIIYFLAAIPTGVVMKLDPFVAAFCAWAGYTAIAAVMLFIGGPARQWLERKFKISPHPNPEKLFWRIWQRGGMPGLGLLAPVTCGPYFAALIALTLGEKPRRLMFWISLGVVPWCLGFVILAATGSTLLKKEAVQAAPPPAAHESRRSTSSNSFRLLQPIVNASTQARDCA